MVVSVVLMVSDARLFVHAVQILDARRKVLGLAEGERETNGSCSYRIATSLSLPRHASLCSCRQGCRCLGSLIHHHKPLDRSELAS